MYEDVCLYIFWVMTKVNTFPHLYQSKIVIKNHELKLIILIANPIE